MAGLVGETVNAGKEGMKILGTILKGANSLLKNPKVVKALKGVFNKRDVIGEKWYQDYTNNEGLQKAFNGDFTGYIKRYGSAENFVKSWKSDFVDFNGKDKKELWYKNREKYILVIYELLKGGLEIQGGVPDWLNDLDNSTQIDPKKGSYNPVKDFENVNQAKIDNGVDNVLLGLDNIFLGTTGKRIQSGEESVKGLASTSNMLKVGVALAVVGIIYKLVKR